MAVNLLALFSSMGGRELILVNKNIMKSFFRDGSLPISYTFLWMEQQLDELLNQNAYTRFIFSLRYYNSYIYYI
jgi:hypothetical protein